MWFYGWDRVVATVCQRLDARLADGGPLVVIGPSGAGKFSLLAAGVLPAIARGALAAPGSTDWPRLLLTPTAAPASALARALGLLMFTDAHTLLTGAAGVVALWDLNVDYAIGRICATSAGALTRVQWQRYVPAQLAYQPPCSG